MPSGQPSFILTHHALAINYAITARFGRNRQVPLSKYAAFMLYLRKSQGFHLGAALHHHSFCSSFYLNHMCQVPSSSSVSSYSSSPFGSCSLTSPAISCLDSLEVFFFFFAFTMFSF